MGPEVEGDLINDKNGAHKSMGVSDVMSTLSSAHNYIYRVLFLPFTPLSSLLSSTNPSIRSTLSPASKLARPRLLPAPVRLLFLFLRDGGRVAYEL